MNEPSSDGEILFIQGIYLQKVHRPTIGYAPIVGAVAMFTEVATKNMFAGLISRQGEWCEWEGYLQDRYGESVLSRIYFANDELHFTKRYLTREDVIDYSFERQPNGLWIGGYEGSAVGKGKASCTLSIPPEQMLTLDF